MTLVEAKRIIDALANGLNPETGEKLPHESALNEPQIIRALFVASQGLGMESFQSNKKSLKPQNAGIPWAKEEEALLVSAYDSGQSISDLVQTHGRTQGAIASRLMRLGRITMINPSPKAS